MIHEVLNVNCWRHAPLQETDCRIGYGSPLTVLFFALLKRMIHLFCFYFTTLLAKACIVCHCHVLRQACLQSLPLYETLLSVWAWSLTLRAASSGPRACVISGKEAHNRLHYSDASGEWSHYLGSRDVSHFAFCNNHQCNADQQDTLFSRRIGIKLNSNIVI